MSPTQFHDQQHHAKKEITSNGNAGGGGCPPPLKVSKDSHGIKKSASSSSSSSAASSLGLTGTAKPSQQQRHPVIIYTHSPKVIHTHPKDFMALVQKLTGLSRNDHHHQEDHRNHNNHHQAHHQQPKAENGCGSGGGGGGGAASAVAEEDSKRIVTNDDNESSSVITDENCEGQVNSCFVPPLFDPPPAPFLTNIPVFTPNSADFLCVNQPYYNYTDSLFFTPNMRSSISSSSSALDGINEFRDY